MVSDNHDTNEPTSFDDAVERGHELAKENSELDQSTTDTSATTASKNAGTKSSKTKSQK